MGDGDGGEMWLEFGMRALFSQLRSRRFLVVDRALRCRRLRKPGGDVMRALRSSVQEGARLLSSRDLGGRGRFALGGQLSEASPGEQARADLLLVTVTLLAAAGWVFSKNALAGLPPLFFMGVRFLLAAAILGCFGFRAFGGLNARDVLAAAAPGLVMAVAMMFWILGLQRAENIGVGAFICSLSVILVPVLGRIAFGARVHRGTWVGAVLACAAMALLFLQDGFRISPADVFFLATAGGLALQLNLNGRIAGRMSPLVLTTVQLCLVGVILLAASASAEEWPDHVGRELVAWVLSSSLLATALRFLLLMKAQRVASPAHAALIMTLEPVWTAVIAAALMGDRMTLQQLVGCSLILLALWVSRWGALRRLGRAGGLSKANVAGRADGGPR